MILNEISSSFWESRDKFRSYFFLKVFSTKQNERNTFPEIIIFICFQLSVLILNKKSFDSLDPYLSTVTDLTP